MSAEKNVSDKLRVFCTLARRAHEVAAHVNHDSLESDTLPLCVLC